MQVHSLFRSLIVAGAVAAAPASLAAQSCMGYALAPSQHAASFVVNGQPEGIDPGPGFSLSGVLKNNASYAVQMSQHYIDTGNIDWEMMYFWQAQAARPVMRTKTLASGATAGPCVLLELGGSSFMETSSTIAGAGFGYSINAPKYALFAAPFAGMVSSGEFSDTYVKLLFGGGTRFGKLLVGTDVTVPVQPSGGETTWNLRLGFGWGKATQIPVAPARTGTTQSGAPQSIAGGAAAAATPSAGAKPYTIEDIEAMVKNGVATTRVLELSKQACLSFRMNDDADTRLRRVGADAALLSGLRQSCYSAS
jgi:hypothetical protein